MVEITEKYEQSIVVTEVSNKSFTTNVYSIGKENFEKACKDITFDELNVGICLTVTSNGMILESYPLLFENIIKINIVKVETTIIGEIPPSNNPITNHTNDSVSQVVSNEATPPESAVSSVPDNNINDSSSNNSSIQDIYNQKYNHNIFSEQTLIKDTFYDEISGYSLPYTIIMPYEYDENINYPVILYLHGAGYLGNDNTSQYTPIEKTFFYNYKWLNNAIIISPQTADWWHYDQYNDSGNLNAVMRLFNKITSEYPCDNRRYYVTGGSMGGYGTWQIALNCSDVFAAAMPLCGWWNPSDANKLCDIPIYITHGLADTTVSPKNATEMYDAIVAAGGDKVKIKLYEDVDHAVWKLTYTDDEILDWLFAQKK